jgi:hypothetical protein
MTTQTFGTFRDDIPESQEFLTLNFTPSSTPERQQRWRNYGLSADFLGDYFANFFPGGDVPESTINLKDTIKATVSYIANELLENAVKYSDESVLLPVSITLRLFDQDIVFQVTNYANQAVAQQYQEFVQTLQTADIDELYTQQLEKTALGEGGSSMGILTIIQDYAAQGGWRFEQLMENPSISKVTVMMHLVV